MIDRASGLQLEDPAASGALWAEIDRAIVDQAPYLWLANPIAVEFVSERVGNYQWTLSGARCSISSGSGSRGASVDLGGTAISPRSGRGDRRFGEKLSKARADLRSKGHKGEAISLPLRRYPEPGLVWNSHVSVREMVSDRLLDLSEKGQPIWLGQRSDVTVAPVVG